MDKLLVVVPTLNSYLLLPKLINSLQMQSFQNWRILFVDGQSINKHKEYIRDLCIKESRCSSIEQSIDCKGIFGAMNQGFENANEDEWIVFWGSDDWAASSETLQRLFALIESCKQKLPDFFICYGRYFNNQKKSFGRITSFGKKGNRRLNSREFSRGLYTGAVPPHQASVFSSRIRNKIPFYDNTFDLAADLDYFLRLSNFNELSVCTLNLELVHMGDEGISGRRHLKRLSEVRMAYQKKFGVNWWIPFVTRYFRKVLSLIHLI